MASAFVTSAYEVAEIMGRLCGDGIIAKPGAFNSPGADTLHADIAGTLTCRHIYITV